LAVSKQYAKEIKRELNYSATWFPNVPVSLGDVGTIKDYQYHHKTSLDNLGIPFKKTKGTTSDQIKYSSRDKVSIYEKVSGQAPLPGSGFTEVDAGVSIKFNKAEATVFHLLGCTSTVINDIKSIGDEIISRYKSKRWDKGNVVITEVVTALKSTILVSQSRDTQVDIKVKTGVGAPGFNLANIGNDSSWSTSKELGVEFVSAEYLKPMFKTRGIKKPWWKPGVEPIFITTSIDLSKVKIVDSSEVKIVDSSEVKDIDLSQFQAIDPSEVEVVEFDEMDYEDFEKKSIVTRATDAPNLLGTIIPEDIAEEMKLSKLDVLEWKINTSEEGKPYATVRKSE
jgi:hypothetical protein